MEIKPKTKITIKMLSYKPTRHRRFPFRLQRIYPPSASGSTCIVSGAAGHQSASGGCAHGSPQGELALRPPQADKTPPQADPPRTASAHSPPIPHPPPHTHLTAYPLFRRRYCSSCTFSTRIELDTYTPYIPNEPNFKTPRLSVTLDMIRTYNEN